MTGNGASYEVQYYQRDHLGNVRMVMNEAGTIVQETEYFPFGLAIPRSGTDAVNKYQYNGKEKQPETGLLDYGARQYDPSIGRWGVVDPLAEKFVWATTYNYVLNNPLKYIDPDGNDIVLVVRGQGNQKDKTLTYKNGNATWNDTGKSYNWKGANNTIARVIKAFQKIEKSNDNVLKDQLYTLETGERKHYIEAGRTNQVRITENELGVAKKGDKLGTTTTFNFSKENREEFEKTEGVKSSDFTTVSHELRHQYDYDQGNMKDSEAVSSAKDPAEIRAVNNENRAREIENIPKRTTYGGQKINQIK